MERNTMKEITAGIISRLEKEKNIWIASVRPNSKPHLVPIWFIWADQVFNICIYSQSVKYLNIAENSSVVLSLEDGSTPVICEGSAEVLPRPWPENIVRLFKQKYDWEIETDEEYDALLRITPVKWLTW
jgi:hypothetical protein